VARECFPNGQRAIAHRAADDLRRIRPVPAQSGARADIATAGARELVFLCGAAEGFPESLRRRATQKLSLSSLTFTHELARAMLAEQLYRAFATLAGHPYPK
jgi:rRNA large subunit m3Psi methyltransferase RlmH